MNIVKGASCLYLQVSKAQIIKKTTVEMSLENEFKVMSVPFEKKTMNLAIITRATTIETGTSRWRKLSALLSSKFLRISLSLIHKVKLFS